MSLIRVLGASGAGKTTLGNNLEARGIPTYDIDNDRLATRVGNNHYQLDPRKIANLKRAAVSNLIVVCGAVRDEAPLWDTFDYHILLVADEDTLNYRMITRSDNNFGKRAEERRMVTERMYGKNEQALAMGAVAIDATQPELVVTNEAYYHIVQFEFASPSFAAHLALKHSY